MNVSNLADRLQPLSLADGGADAKASLREVESEGGKSGSNGSDAEPMSCDAWKSLYERTAIVETERLLVSHPQLSEQECRLVESLNDALRTGKSHWTVLEIPQKTPPHIIRRLLQITEVTGDFFTRTWFIREKKTGSLIGMMQTSALDKRGLSEVDTHLEPEYCSQGYGTEALMGVVELYRPYTGRKMLMPSFLCLKENFLSQLKIIVPFYLKEDAPEFLSRVESLSDNTRHLFNLSDYHFPDTIHRILYAALTALSQCQRAEVFEYKGLWAYAATGASSKSLKKCGFVKKGEDKWFHTC